MADELKPPVDSITPEIPPIRVSPIGFNGLNITSGYVYEENDPALRWPQCQYTFKQMLKDSTISVSVDAVTRIASKVPSWFEAPAGQEKEQEYFVKKLNTMFSDMSTSWFSVKKQIMTFVHHGFSYFEVIPRQRLNSKGSRYNDGLWGIGKIALRSQDTISAVEYKNNGRDFVGFWQRVNKPTNKNQFGIKDRTVTVNGKEMSEVLLPLDKCLLFRNNAVKDTPYGISPLVGVYEAWRYKKAYEEAESFGIQSDVNGLKVLYMPPQYMKPDALPEDAQAFEMYKSIMRRVHLGQESGVILPQVLDDRGEQYFKLEVLSTTGKKSHDIDKIIQRYKNEIIVALYANSLVTGMSGEGSMALSESQLRIRDDIIESFLAEVADVINHYLIPRIFSWNGWKVDECPKLVFGKVSEPTLEQMSSAGQRFGAVGLIPRTPKTINYIQSLWGNPERIDEDMSQEELDKLLGANESKSGAGMAEGMPNGTGSGNSNNSKTNSGNKA